MKQNGTNQVLKYITNNWQNNDVNLKKPYKKDWMSDWNLAKKRFKIKWKTSRKRHLGFLQKVFGPHFSSTVSFVVRWPHHRPACATPGSASMNQKGTENVIKFFNISRSHGQVVRALSCGPRVPRFNSSCFRIYFLFSGKRSIWQGLRKLLQLTQLWG